MKPWLFTVYRVLLAVVLIIWISMDIPRESHTYFKDRTQVWLVYATNWALGLLTLTFLFLAVFCLIYNCPTRKYAKVALFQPIWLLYTVATNGTIVVCLVFWVALSNSNFDIFTNFWGRLKHSLTVVLVLVDVALSAIPFRLVHVVYPLLGGLLYALFSYVFWAAGGTGPVAVGQVYPGVNWAHPKATVLALLCALFVTFIIHIALYMAYFFRLKIKACMRMWAPVDAVSTSRTGYDVGSGYGDNQTVGDLNSVTSSMNMCVDKSNREYRTID